VPAEVTIGTPGDDHDDADSQYIDPGSSDAGDMDQGMDEDEPEDATPADMIDITNGGVPTPGSVILEPTGDTSVLDNIVIDITSSAAPTPAPADEDSDSDMALAGIFTPHDEEAPGLPPTT
jgi:hypothetical protein